MPHQTTIMVLLLRDTSELNQVCIIPPKDSPIHVPSSGLPAYNFQIQYSAIADCLNSLPNDGFLEWSKLKAFADDKLNLKN